MDESETANRVAFVRAGPVIAWAQPSRSPIERGDLGERPQGGWRDEATVAVEQDGDRLAPRERRTGATRNIR